MVENIGLPQFKCRWRLFSNCWSLWPHR